MYTYTYTHCVTCSTLQALFQEVVDEDCVVLDLPGVRPELLIVRTAARGGGGALGWAA